ncbi:MULTISPECIES: 4Fe-4S dicluster domain-containing protein [Pelosinus]|uniref:Indolepyruvate ferredoxin oxidoreductase n=2 Tax=Pelosinus TaxID=365348 RepID=I9LFX8_9FIRM|nr:MULTISPECIES: 4Fe-4S dicluster domain-containing protein [Pelosinus]EIW19379.1 indolepyruvate ferredoxin oxidoreductase [Pelosinus fermentans B4]EIW24890.1 4Fe-4S ferredoxin iron-sulfur binding domain-containing protein [Pelosinus fermentans A11]
MIQKEVKDAFDWALALNEPSVIITRWPCVLKRLSDADKIEFGDYKGLCQVAEEICIGCKMCIKTGCPALQFNKETKKVKIDKVQCVGCKLCLQVCPVK